MRDVAQRNSASDGDTTLVLLLEGDIGWLLVDPNAKSFQFTLDDPFVCQGLIYVKDDEDQVARLCDRNDLSSAASPIFSYLDDTR